MFITALGLLLMSFSKLNNDNDVFTIKTVVIDAGHGGRDPGCVSGSNHEKTIALNIAKQLGKMITDSFKNVKVIYTREEDKYVELWERASIANRNNADIFFSIHVNANDNVTVYGTESYAMGTHVVGKNLNARKEEQEIAETTKRENEVILEEDGYQEKYDGFNPNDPASHIVFELFQSEYIEQSLELASKIQTKLKDHSNRRNRGVKQAGFVVLWKTTMPAVLIETGYLTNSDERTHLTSDHGQKNIASGIFSAFVDYKASMESKSKSSD
ncbi:MAG: N-acetylmuramoyl-L-alanine amidase [Bacteroidetes bacterium]|nr:N-acetylmuramoyl-L-alanine amidase [Bacteroidota bacterium]